MTTASAPGKLLLFGEYAVLEGAKAIVGAVDRRATVAIRRDGGGRLLSAQIAPDPIPYVLRDGSVHWDCADSLKPRLILARRLIESRPRSAPEIRIDTAAFQHQGEKLGLGSSAAVTVAWVAAADRSADPAALRAEADALHSGFQGGQGSGADVAASTYGGLLAYRRGSSPERLAWPPRLCWTLVWTRDSADTREFLTGFGAWRRSSPADYARFVDKLTDLAERGVDAFTEAQPDAFLELVRRYCGELEEMGRSAGLQILNEAHREIRAMARECEVAYKPSGAGGGDCGIGFATDPDRLARFRQRLEAAGVTALDIAIDPAGVRLETDSQP